jgi:uncharacterized membrane protein YbhN (UPF0104 family)
MGVLSMVTEQCKNSSKRAARDGYIVSSFSHGTRTRMVPTQIPDANAASRTSRKWIKMLGLCSASVLLLCAGLWLSGVEKALEDLGRFPAWAIASVLAAFSLNLAVVSFRLERLLAHFGIQLSFFAAFRVCLHGQFASFFLISLFGQIMGRYWALRQHGVASMTVAMLTVIERLAMLFVCGGLCLLGGLRLLENGRISAFLGRTSLLSMLITAMLALLISLWAGRSKFKARMFAQMSARESVGNFLEIGAITLLSQLLVLGAFVLAGKGLAPEAGWMDLLAAAALTSFAASVPISIGGWGVRELTAIFAFGQFGVPASSALAVSVLIGLASTATLLAVYPFAFGKGKVLRNNDKKIKCKGA